MALKLIPLDEAARMLGISVERLNQLRERQQIYGYRDGASWKFKQPDIERLADDLRAQTVDAPLSGSDSDELSDSVQDSLENDPLAATMSEASDDFMPDLSDVTPLPGAAGHGSDSVDVVLLSDRELGASEPGTSSTIIGKPGVQSPEESDIRLVARDSRPAGQGSDVKLKVDRKASESGLRLVPEPSAKGGVELPVEVAPDAPTDLRLEDSDELSIDVLSDSSHDDLPVTAKSPAAKKPATPPPSKAKPKAKLPDKDSAEIDIAPPDSDDEFAIADVKAPLAKPGDSGVTLASHDLDDDDLVLSSSGGSDITLGSADSGISLASPSDSGLSLEEPLELKAPEDESLELGGEFGIADADSDSADVAPADDDFLLTPIEEAADVDSEDSGSQVIALDSDSGFGDSGLLEADSAAGGMLEEDFGPADGGQSLGMGLSPAPALATGGVALPGMVAREAPYTVWNVLSLVACAMILSLTGMMMFDLIRNMWSWDSPYGFNSALMDMVTGLFGS